MSKLVVISACLVALAHVPDAGAGPHAHAGHPVGSHFHAPKLSSGVHAGPKLTQHSVMPVWSNRDAARQGAQAGRAFGTMVTAAAAMNPFWAGAVAAGTAAAMMWFHPVPFAPMMPFGLTMGGGLGGPI